MTDIAITEHTEQPTAVLRARIPLNELQGFFSRAFPAAAAALQAQGRYPAGPPFGKYYGMPTDTVDVEAGFPASGPIAAEGGIVPGTLPAGRVVEATHVGPYDTIHETYAAVQRFFADNGLTPGDVMWECYLSDPERQPDPSTWRTQICWPVA
ncbi:GyrI-like domain-containing protein [Leifsonia xyli]|uniref:GyrI-like domain-containing protein n=1 Tax=Leifsonia xyli TaxID=1575 RepID=UPI003D677C91